MSTWKRPEEFARLLEELDGNDFWELANNEGGEMAARLCEALDLLSRAADRLDFDPQDPDGPAIQALFAWAQTATGYADEDQDACESGSASATRSATARTCRGRGRTTMGDRKPWHDTVMHVADAKDGPCGPYVPVGDFVESPPMGSPRAIRCAACGHEPEPGSWSDEELAQIWWSAGAWTGHEEPPCFPRSMGPGTCLLLADNVEEARDLLRRAARILEAASGSLPVEDRWDAEDALRAARVHADLLDECMEDHT